MLIRRWLPAVILAGGLTASALAGDPRPLCPDLMPAAQQSVPRCVMVECRVVRLGDSYFDDAEVFDPRGKAMLSAADLDRFLAAVQADPGSQIVAAPKVMVVDGQEANVWVGDNCDVCGQVQMERSGRLVSCGDCPGSLNSGLGITVTPHVLPGGQGVQLNSRVEWVQTASYRLPFPVTTFVTEALEASSQGRPIPFTQFVQEPTLQSRSAFVAKSVRAGETMLIDLGRSEREVRRVKSFPILSDLPLIGEMFQSTEYVTEASHLIVCLTPRDAEPAALAAACPAPMPRRPASPAPGELVLAEFVTTADPPAPALDTDAAKKLAFHLDCYRRACAAGLKDEATEHAHRCLEIDPACFMKPMR